MLLRLSPGQRDVDHKTMQTRPKGRTTLILFTLTVWVDITTGLCPVTCRCDDELLIAQCDKSSLDVIPITLHPGLRELNLGSNNIKSVKDSLDVYKELVFLNLSDNSIKSIDELSFQRLRNLEKLLLQRNNVQKLYNKSFSGLQSLETLDLKNNLVAELPGHVFKELYSLKILDLSDNFLTKIEKNIFYGLKNLKDLRLRGNLLDYIPSDALNAVPQLNLLDLGKNSFGEVLNNAFVMLYNLEELCLDGCGISIIHSHAFRWLSSLLKLRLNNNNLREIPSRALFDVIRLEDLDISDNLFVSIKALAFQRLRYLKVITISNCPYLNTIHHYAFAENVNLEAVSIEQNGNLRFIDPGAFDAVRNLRKADFRGNSLSNLDEDLLPWSQLTYLDVDDNPFYCNCSLLWLWHELRVKHANKSGSPKCSEPENLHGRLILEVDSTDFECDGQWTGRHILMVFLAVTLLSLLITLTIVVKRRSKRIKQFEIRWAGRVHCRMNEDDRASRNHLLLVAHSGNDDKGTLRSTLETNGW